MVWSALCVSEVGWGVWYNNTRVSTCKQVFRSQLLPKYRLMMRLLLESFLGNGVIKVTKVGL